MKKHSVLHAILIVPHLLFSCWKLIAQGMAFNRNKVVQPFWNTELNNVMCKIFGHETSRNDGSLVKERGIMRNVSFPERTIGKCM